MIVPIAIGFVTVVFVAYLLAVRRLNRIERAWRAERERLETYGEHVAVANGHPRTGDILVYPADHDDAA
jgi:hypothetical protein